MNVLQVVATPVYPPKRGGSHRAHGLVATIPEYGGRVRRFCQTSNINDFRDIREEQCIHIADEYEEFVCGDAIHALPRTLSPFKTPVTVFSGRLLSLAPPDRLCRSLKWADITLVEHPWQVAAVSSLSSETPVVYSSHNVESEVFDPTEKDFLYKWYYQKVNSIEREAVQTADALVSTCQRDQERFVHEFGADCPTHIAPNAVPKAALETARQPNARESLIERHDLPTDTLFGLFVGSCYKPNVEAVDAIVSAASECDGNVSFLIVGDVGNAFDSANLPSNVVTTGFVDDIDLYYAGADIGLNPIRSGGGSNIKLIDYFAHGLPVVSTPFGVRGFDVTNEDEVLVVDADKLGTTLADFDHESVMAMGERAREYVRKHHIWETVSSKLYDWLASVVVNECK